MKICVLGLDGATPDVIFHDERLANLRRLMDLGVYGRLKSVLPASTIPAWACMVTSQDPDSLGLAGDHRPIGSEKLEPVSSASVKAPAIWDHLSEQGKRSIIVGVPPNSPPRRVNGISIGCFLTPDPVSDVFTWPENIKGNITELVGDYPADVKNLCLDREDRLKDEILSMSRKQWQVVRWLLTEQAWDYFHFVDIGLNRIYRAYEDCFDPRSGQFQRDSPRNAISEYCLWLDEQVGAVLELLVDDTIVLVVSACGTVCQEETSEAGSDSCASASYGMFILAAPNCPLSGEFEGAALLDMAPTLLDLGGYQIPASMQGRSLVQGMEKKSPNRGPRGSDDQQSIHDRLAGLGYI